MLIQQSVTVLSLAFVAGAAFGVLARAGRARLATASGHETDATHAVARTAVGCGAVAAQVALGFYQVLLPVLVVPRGAMETLWMAYALELGLTVWLAIRRPWLAPLVPLLTLPSLLLTLDYGEAHWGWVA
jgi:hypothetical protein